MIHAMKKASLVKGCHSGKQTAILNSYRVGLHHKATFEQRLQGGKGFIWQVSGGRVCLAW